MAHEHIWRFRLASSSIWPNVVLTRPTLAKHPADAFGKGYVSPSILRFTPHEPGNSQAMPKSNPREPANFLPFLAEPQQARSALPVPGLRTRATRPFGDVECRIQSKARQSGQASRTPSAHIWAIGKVLIRRSGPSPVCCCFSPRLHRQTCARKYEAWEPVSFLRFQPHLLQVMYGWSPSLALLWTRHRSAMPRKRFAAPHSILLNRRASSPRWRQVIRLTLAQHRR